MSESDLDDLVRRVDPDRWLASRFVADEGRRATVIALYALNYELSRVGPNVSQSLVGEIRLAWWRERIEAIAAGGEPPGQPVLSALRAPIASGIMPLKSLELLIEARHADLEPAPFADELTLTSYVDGTSGVLMHLAARVLEPSVEPAMTLMAARAWGWADLLRATPAWRERARRWAPLDWGELSDAALGVRVRARVEEATRLGGRELRRLPVAAFPAVAYATLARPYARGRSVSELERRARLTFAAALGRV